MPRRNHPLYVALSRCLLESPLPDGLVVWERGEPVGAKADCLALDPSLAVSCDETGRGPHVHFFLV